MPRTTRTFATLELSQAAYDEIEAKLLAAGYEHLFAAGPGSAIDLQGIAVTRELMQDFLRVGIGELVDDRLKKILGTVGNAQEASQYCFMCDDMVSQACDRENCLRAANDRVRADLGLVP
jgi:hypothetical protein